MIDHASEMAAFVRVVDSKGFSAAAPSLGLTPSAVSKLVTRLETRLGVRLLQRTTRAISLTEEGEAFYATARRIVGEIETLENALDDLKDEREKVEEDRINAEEDEREAREAASPIKHKNKSKPSEWAEFLGRREEAIERRTTRDSLALREKTLTTYELEITRRKEGKEKEIETRERRRKALEQRRERLEKKREHAEELRDKVLARQEDQMKKRVEKAERIAADWDFLVRPGQRAPAGDWRIWLMMAGRGFGKTRAGAEWVRGIAEADPAARIALVGASLGEAYVNLARMLRASASMRRMKASKVFCCSSSSTSPVVLRKTTAWNRESMSGLNQDGSSVASTR